VGLEFSYTRLDGKTIEVAADPYRIANFNNYWYLIAYDPASERIKSYYLGNIFKLRTLYENFTADPALEQEVDAMCTTIDSVWFKKERKSVTLDVKGRAHYYLKRYLPVNVESIEEREEGALLTFFYYNEMELFDFLKHWLPDIRIMDAPKLQAEFESIVQQYFNG